MKIALVHDFLVKLGGAERVLKVLMDIYPDAPVFTLLYDEKVCGNVFAAERIRPSFLQKLPAFLRKRQRYLFPFMPRATESFDLSGFDVIISSNSAYSHGILTPSPSVHICYCHSPMRYLWDYTHDYLAEQKVGKFSAFFINRLLHKLRLWDQIVSKRVDFYLANSWHVRRRIQKYYRQQAQVLYPPVAVHRFKLSPRHQDYFLIVAALTPFKKIDLAIHLFNKIQKKLIVIGSGNQFEYFKSIAGSTVEVIGSRSDKEVVTFLQNCRAFIMTNEEDFGIAPVEAMACGKPVLAYGKGGILETVIPGVTGEFFYEQTLEALEDGLGRLIMNEPQYKAENIRKRAQMFSEKHFIKGIQEAVSAAKAGKVWLSK